MIAGAFVSLGLFALFSFRRHKTHRDENLFAIEMLILAMAAALPAAMVFDSLFKMQQTGIFKIQGATFYGGLIGALALFPLLLLLKRNRKVTVYERLCDLAPAIPAGHCLGRLGCFLGGCCFGKPTEGSWGIVFPQGSMPYEFYGGEVAIHPTQLYEAAYLLVLFIVLAVFTKRTSFPLYLILYGVGRFIIEFFRADDRGSLFGFELSPAQIISIILIVIGILLFSIRLFAQKHDRIDQK